MPSKNTDTNSKVAALLRQKTQLTATQTSDRAKLAAIQNSRPVGAAFSAKAAAVAELLGDKTAPTVVFDASERQRLNERIGLTESALAELDTRISQARLSAGYEASQELKPTHAEHVAAVVKSLEPARAALKRYADFKAEAAANGITVSAWSPLPDKLIDVIDAYCVSAKDISR